MELKYVLRRYHRVNGQDVIMWTLFVNHLAQFITDDINEIIAAL